MGCDLSRLTWRVIRYYTFKTTSGYTYKLGKYSNDLKFKNQQLVFDYDMIALDNYNKAIITTIAPATIVILKSNSNPITDNTETYGDLQNLIESYIYCSISSDNKGTRTINCQLVKGKKY